MARVPWHAMTKVVPGEASAAFDAILGGPSYSIAIMRPAWKMLADFLIRIGLPGEILEFLG